MHATRVDQGRDRPHVALIVETSINYGRGLLRGITQYLRESGPWSIFLEQRELGAELPSWIDRWEGDGIITRSGDPRILEAGIPTVALFDHTGKGLGLPRILNDNVAIGRMAAQHLIQRGFRTFGYIGMSGEFWSDLRWRGVQEALRDVSCEPFLFSGTASEDWESRQDALAGWIGSLPKPLGLIACNDIHGLRVLDACRRAGLLVPEVVAVIGADNDLLLCELSDPPLSSIAVDGERVGYEAAKLLDRLMRGEAAPPEAQLIPPKGVITRQSTEVVAILDPCVAQALHIIHRHACSRIDVRSVLEEVPISRRALEIRFRTQLGRSPGEEIQRVRIERAKTLLTETDLPLAVIGRQLGFNKPGYFSTAFKNRTGVIPSTYRRMAGRVPAPSAIDIDKA